MFQIKNRWMGVVLRTVEAESLTDADLRGADLRGADLRGADLRDADLRDADLRDADLRDAILTGADLRDADLRGADLRDADLTGADLTGADLRDADLSRATLPDGTTPETYDPSPVFVGAAPVPSEAWSCNTWENCPLHHAYGAGSLEAVPEAVRGLAATWLALYDGKHACALRGLR